MKKEVRKEVKKLIEELQLSCSVEEFKDKVCWDYISSYQKLPLSFIREFKDKVNWHKISTYQKLSEQFIREFKDEVDWCEISYSQKLSENFIRKFKNEVIWLYISKYQKLSEEFIREFKDKANWTLYKKVNKTLTYQEKLKEAKAYAKKYDLKVNSKYLHAYREHNFNSSGMFKKTIIYKKGQYYRDWHLDMRKEEQNSFGLGIFPEGNTSVRVKISDWGVEVADDGNRGKARVWGFEVI